MSCLGDYYSSHDEEARLLSGHGQVEYLTAMRYIHRYLAETEDPDILEVGAGTGAFPGKYRDAVVKA